MVSVWAWSASTMRASPRPGGLLQRRPYGENAAALSAAPATAAMSRAAPVASCAQDGTDMVLCRCQHPARGRMPWGRDVWRQLWFGRGMRSQLEDSGGVLVPTYDQSNLAGLGGHEPSRGDRRLTGSIFRRVGLRHAAAIDITNWSRPTPRSRSRRRRGWFGPRHHDVDKRPTTP